MSTLTIARTGSTSCASTDEQPAGSPQPAARRAPRQPIGPLLPVTGGGLQVPLVDGRLVRYANLDYAASAPALQAVTDLVAQALPFYSSVHRGAGYTSQVSTSLYESAREEIAAFLGARDGDVTIFTRNTTDALTLLSSAVPTTGPGTGEVLVLDVEHHANLLPWTSTQSAGRFRLIPAASTLAGTVAALEQALRERPATLVTITGASNVTGEVTPLDQIIAIAHAHGARVAVDAAQLAPHRRIDLRELDADYLAFSGHKTYAPFGSGVLIGRRDWLDAAAPHQLGGGAVQHVSDDGQADWAPAPARHEGGTPNVIGAAALAAACRAIAALPDGAVRAHEEALRNRLIAGLGALPGVHVLKIWDDSQDAVGVVGFTVEGHDAGRVAAYLSAEHGIGVRDGKFCAHPLLRRLGTSDGALRASLGLGSRSDDVDRLINALRRLLEHGETAQYVLDGGRWAPSPDPRPAPAWAPWNTSAGSSPCEAV
jgi:selenocysteine lyase/cysteine desulfurase